MTEASPGSGPEDAGEQKNTLTGQKEDGIGRGFLNGKPCPERTNFGDGKLKRGILIGDG